MKLLSSQNQQSISQYVLSQPSQQQQHKQQQHQQQQLQLHQQQQPPRSSSSSSKYQYGGSPSQYFSKSAQNSSASRQRYLGGDQGYSSAASSLQRTYSQPAIIDNTNCKYSEIAVKLDIELSNKLNSLASTQPSHILTDNKFGIYRSVFAQICQHDIAFSSLLLKIKSAYQEKLNMVLSQKSKSKFFNSSPSTYEILHDELKMTKNQLNQEKEEKIAMQKRMEQMALQIKRLHLCCDHHEGYMRDMKRQVGASQQNKNETVNNSSLMAREAGLQGGNASDLLNQLQIMYDKYNQQNDLLKKYKTELKKSKNQELLYYNLLQREAYQVNNSSQGRVVAGGKFNQQSSGSNTISYASPVKTANSIASRQTIHSSNFNATPKKHWKKGENLGSEKKQPLVPHGSFVQANFSQLNNNFNRHNQYDNTPPPPKMDNKKNLNSKNASQNKFRASSAMRVDQIVQEQQRSQQIDLQIKRKFSQSPQPISSSSNMFKRKIKIPKLDFSKLKMNNSSNKQQQQLKVINQQAAQAKLSITNHHSNKATKNISTLSPQKFNMKIKSLPKNNIYLDDNSKLNQSSSSLVMEEARNYNQLRQNYHHNQHLNQNHLFRNLNDQQQQRQQNMNLKQQNQKDIIDDFDKDNRQDVDNDSMDLDDDDDDDGFTNVNDHSNDEENFQEFYDNEEKIIKQTESQAKMTQNKTIQDFKIANQHRIPNLKIVDNSNQLEKSIDKIELAHQKLSNYLSNHSFTAAELNKSYDQKQHQYHQRQHYNSNKNYVKNRASQSNTNEKFNNHRVKEEYKKSNQQSESNQHHHCSDNRRQGINMQIMNTSMENISSNQSYSSSQSSSCTTSSNKVKGSSNGGGVIIPKIDINSIQNKKKHSQNKFQNEKVNSFSQNLKVKNTTVDKSQSNNKERVIPNLGLKINTIKSVQPKILNINQIPRNQGFHQEFLQNFDQFSQSWREQVRKMEERKHHNH